jgi:hypothetical protein
MKSATKAGRNQVVVYWITTAVLALELTLGGLWDVLRVPQVQEVTDRLGCKQVISRFDPGTGIRVQWRGFK